MMKLASNQCILSESYASDEGATVVLIRWQANNTLLKSNFYRKIAQYNHCFEVLIINQVYN